MMFTYNLSLEKMTFTRGVFFLGEKMKKIIALLCCSLLFGCNGPKVVNDATIIDRNVEVKESITEDFFEGSLIKPISLKENQNFNSVNEWYDNSTVIYSVENNGISSLYLKQLYSGQTDLFFQSEEFFVKIEANADHTLFAIQTLEKSGGSKVSVLNKMGKEVFVWSGVVDDLQFSWNPFKNDELILTKFLPSLQFEVYKVNVSKRIMTQVQVNNPFVQWTGNDQIGYLKWDQTEPKIDAPLYLKNLTTFKEEKWLEHCIMFFAHHNIVVAISVNPSNSTESLYSFYDSITGERIKDVNIPVLNTFSEAWWLPSHDYDKQKKLFYYMTPYRSGDITEYNEGFKLTMMSMDGSVEAEVLTTVPNNIPIKLSPNGEWCLLGQQLEKMINVTTKQVFDLITITTK